MAERRGDKPCACGCGKSARAGEYNSDCRVACKCGCGGRARYAYINGHAPTPVTCKRCGKSFAPKGKYVNCSQCRRHLRRGAPAQRLPHLVGAHARQKQAPPGRKWCTGCQKYRSEKFFGAYTENGNRKLYPRCKPCAKAQSRARTWMSKYGLTADEYELIKTQQGGVCAICRRHNGSSKALAVDHDHVTGIVRGLLCGMCNKNVLGHLRDDPEAFMRGCDYLNNPPAVQVLGERIAPIELVTPQKE